MAEAFVNVTEGSGKKLHAFDKTIGANTVLDEVVLLGENYLASYTTTTGPAALATAASHIFQLMAGASLKVRIRRIQLWQQAAVTTALLDDFLLYRLTTAGTGGTVGGSNPLDPSDAACGATVMFLPTVKGTEGNLMMRAFPYMIQTIGASTFTANPVLVWDFDRPRSKPLIIAAGVANGIAIKNTTASAAGAVNTICIFDETNF